jgi:uncharacterized RDD family membrane protein YckC
MLCVRCSHPLPSRADRCIRCFELSPPSEAVSLGAPLHQQAPEPMSFDLTSEPPARDVTLSIASDPPPDPGMSMDGAGDAPAFSIDSEPPPQSGSFRISRDSAPFLARVPDTDPDPVAATDVRQPATPVAAADAGQRATPVARMRKTQNLSLPFDSAPVLSAPAVSVAAPGLPDAQANPAAPEAETSAAAGGSVRASSGSRLGAWAIDSALLMLLCCGQILLAARLTNHDWVDLALSRPLFPFWVVLLACDAIACSWMFAAAGRTPGMLAMGQRFRTLEGGVPTPGEALQRALLSVLSAAPAMFGFSFALFDTRGQTLHDKLCGCIVTID